MKQIVLFVESKLLSFQKTRLGLDYYLKKRLNVRIFNISPIVRPEYFKKYFPTNRIKFPKEEILENKIQILDAIKKFDSKTFVFLHITKSIKTKFIFDELEEKYIKYAYVQVGNLPTKSRPIFEIIKFSFLFPIAAIKKILSKYNDLENFGKKPNYVFCAGKKYYSDAKEKFKNSKIIKIPSWDYDEKISINKQRLNLFKNSKDYAVYLDMGYNHPDRLYTMEKYFPPERAFDYDAWYNPLNNFFKQFISCTNLDLKIAAHPRSIYKKNPIKFGKIYFNKTIELISRSRIVLLHRSTALHFAILFQKPLMFLTGDNHNNRSKRWTNDIADYFNKKPINISTEKFSKEIFYNEMKLNKKIYGDFKKNFIVDIKNLNKTSYEIMFSNINKSL